MGAAKNLNDMPKASPELSVYGYTDYRAYLRAFYNHKKQSVRGYSYRAFSKAAGFTSPNFLKLVIEGKRNIGNDALGKFVKALHLNNQMGEYFTALVNMNQSKTDAEKEQWFLEIQKLTPHAKKRQLHVEEHQYLSHWLYPAIREMIALDDFSDDPYWIARRLNGNANVGEIAAAMKFLVEEGYIRKGVDGSYSANDNIVITSDEVKNLAIRNYHRQMMEQAKVSLESIAMSEREFAALTFTLPEKSMAELKSRLKAFRQDIHDWAMQAAAANGHDAVVQLNFQMYPHSKLKGDV